MKHLKYYGTIFLSLLPFLIAIGFILLGAFTEGQTIEIAGNSIKSYYLFIVGGVFLFIGLILRKPLRSVRVKARRDVEYDEYGRSRSKGTYEHLSKAERNLIDLQKTAEIERLISSTEIKKITKQGSMHPMEDMENLVGLIPVKEKMKEMVARMEFEKSEKKSKNSDLISSSSGHHCVFYGNPGTGKTTVARILTGFLYKYHYIQKNKCIEVDGNFLNAGNDSALKTELLVRFAMGGVLFIDEAYAIMAGTHGIEVVATLIKQMEDHRNEFVLILAGYTEEMRYLLNANPGFLSRIKEYLYFPDFSIEELRKIFTLMAAEQKFQISESSFNNFDIRIEKEKGTGYFGNGRTVRNILDEAIDKHAYNFYCGNVEPQDKYQLGEEDISIYPTNTSMM